MSPLAFSATTLRVTSIDDERFRTPIGDFVLAGSEVRLTTHHETAEGVRSRFHVSLPDGHPDEWERLEVDIRCGGPWLTRAIAISDAMGDVTVTSECAVEAWGERSADGSWPVLVVPSLSFESMGCAAAVGQGHVEFSGRLFPDLWGVKAMRERLPWASDGRKRPFVGALPTEPGELWRVGTTQVPPPKEGPVPLRVTPFGEVPGAVPR
ncbi:hypothetical protein [Streptomyces millisiae]|uniref:Uncharacterized protein n=1 Tax=Streptomyces millisiae TaxID=3075542 RepID=A0ABU2M041_9ACTN|nr:hypothetical protein [Streptomyces sp. DSM 44918]MDT0323165.1 hypothetical protein [Streptomyces sp. DSM 44918]